MRDREWLDADPYLTRHLADHAAKAGMLDRFVEDVGYLSIADPTRLVPVLSSLTDGRGRRIGSVYRRVANLLLSANPVERMALLHFTALKEDPRLAPTLKPLLRPGWSARWTHWRRTIPSTVIAELDAQPNSAAIALHPEEGPLLIAGAHGVLSSWRLGALSKSDTFRVPVDGTVTSLAVGHLQDGPIGVLGMEDGRIGTFELPSLREVSELREAHKKRVRDLVTVSGSQGTLLASCADDLSLALWRLPDLKLLARRENTTYRPEAVAFAAIKGKSVLVSAGDIYGGKRGEKPIRVWSVPELGLIREIGNSEPWMDHLYVVSFQDGAVILGSIGGRLWCWDLESGEPLDAGRPQEVWISHFLPLSATESTADLMVSGGTGRFGMVTVERSPHAFSVRVSPWVETEMGIWCGPVDVGGRRFVVSVEREIREWEVPELTSAISSAPENYKEMSQVQREYEFRSVLAVGSRVWSGSGLGRLHCWDEEDGRELFPPSGEGSALVRLCSARLNGQTTLVMGDEDGLIRLVNAETGRTYPTQFKAGDDLYDLAVSNLDGQPVLATVAKTQSRYLIRFWRIPSGEEVETSDRTVLERKRQLGMIPEHEYGLSISGRDDKMLSAVTFGSSDLGPLVIAGGYAPELGAWSAETFHRELDLGLEIHDRDSHVTSLASYRTKDGFEVAAGTTQGEVVRWELLHGKRLGVWRAHSHRVILAVIHWQGEEALASGGGDGWLRIVSIGDWRQLFLVQIGDLILGIASVANGDLAVATRRGIVVLSKG